MPYIEKGRREPLGGQCRSIGSSLSSSGELNYAITQILLGYVSARPCYTLFNNALGALDCAAREFYRRVVVPYEEGRKEINGDVY